MYSFSDIEKAVSITNSANWYDIEDPLIQNHLIFKPKINYVFLSDEAKYIINLVVKCPSELLDAKVGGHPVVSKRGKITAYRLAKYLRIFLNWNKKDIDRTFKELKEYVKEF